MAKKTKKKLPIIYVANLHDGEDCGGDYSEVAVILDNKVLVKYGDHYHDKGKETAIGFVDGFNFISDIKYQRSGVNIAMDDEGEHTFNDKDILIKFKAQKDL